MKLRRRKKNGHEVGNWFVVVDGRWKNLETKDNRLARKRAALFLKGKWPEGQAEEAAADVVKRAEHIPDDGNLSGGEAALEPEAPEAPEVVPPPPAQDSPTDAGGGEDSPDPAEVAAAAGDAGEFEPAGVLQEPGEAAPVDLAVEMGKELQRELFPEGGTATTDPGKLGASILFSVEHALASKIAARAKPPRFIEEPTEDDFLFRVTACACRVLGRNYTGEIKIHPLYVLLGVAIIGYPMQLAFMARTEEQIKAEVEAAKAEKGAA